jgi:glycogen phosphorylase
MSTPRVAYFCMEYGLAPELPIYAGGLGVLAGDTMKSAGDLGLPVVGVGILWSHGYATQSIGEDGLQHERYHATPRDAFAPLDVRVEVTIAGKEVPLRAYRVERHLSADLYVLEPESAADRWITRSLYGGGVEDRVAQEIVLGVGGVRLLDALGKTPDVYHFNEGHAVFAGLELVRRRRAEGGTLAEVVEEVRRKVVFTTHTPVPAGNESHGLELLEKMNANLGLTRDELEEIGGDPFNMTVAGLRLSRRANGVAELHGETARKMWKDVSGAAPILSITNGVHLPTWQDTRVRDATLGRPEEERRHTLWEAHQEIKRGLISDIRERTGAELREDRLLVGFARRAAPYKRADLLFADRERVERLFADSRLQLVFAGKAHPANASGKAIVARLVAAARNWPDNVVFLEDYDMTLGALLTRGCDVWLNNPRRPLEASGTSGMKAAMNGVLNLSILDGWWPEGCVHGETGWRIGEPIDGPVVEDDDEEIDTRDREALYRTLEQEVLPRYYDDRARWVQMMDRSIAMSTARFTSDRMLRQYYEQLYTR